MFKRSAPFLLLASLTVSACATSPQPSPQPMPPLDSALAQPCQQLQAPTELNFDVWQAWITDTVLKAYGECAARHAATVKAWPK